MTAKKRRCAPLAQYMKLHKIGAPELAERLGQPVPTVRSWANGWRSIRAETAVLIEKRLGIPRETLRPDLFVRRA